MKNITTSKQSLHATKLVRMLSTFPEREILSFEKWLASPWCNPTKCLVDILVALKKYHPEFAPRKLNKRSLFEKALGRVPSDRRMNNLLSEMYLQAEQFLTHERLRHDDQTRTELLLSTFSERKLNEWLEKKTEREFEKLEQKKSFESRDHFFAYRINKLLDERTSLSLKYRKNSPALGNAMKALKLYTLLENANSINSSLSLNRALKQSNKSLEIEIENWIMMSRGIDHPSINLYRKRFEFAEENDKDRFKILEPLFLKNYQSISAKDQKIHFTLLVNDFMRLRRKGKFESGDSLQLYKLGARELWILQEGSISTFMYLNILSSSNAKRDFEFSRAFIEKFSPKLPLMHREEGRVLGLAHTLNKEEEYDKVIGLLLSIEFKSPYFQRVSRFIMIQACFGLHLENASYQSFLLDYCDAYEKQLRREKVKGENQSWIRFVQFTRALSKLYYAIPFEGNKVKSLFKDTSTLQGAAWLKIQKRKVLQLKK